MTYADLVKRIRDSESEELAIKDLEAWAGSFEYRVGLDIGQQHDQASVVVCCRRFNDGPMHVVFAENLAAAKNMPPATRAEWVGLTDDEMWNAYTGGSDIINLDYAKAIESMLKEKNT
jgi:hypothetical protein